MNVQWLMAASISEVNIQASSQTSRQLSKDRYLKKQWQKFLSVVLKDEEKVEDKLEDLLHTLNAGQPRLIDQEITGSAQFRNAEKSKLNPPKRKPNEMELKKMFSITLVWIVKYVMENLLDTFGWKKSNTERWSPNWRWYFPGNIKAYRQWVWWIFEEKLKELEIMLPNVVYKRNPESWPEWL